MAQQNTPPGTLTAEQLITLPDYKFKEIVAQRLAFTRQNQWIWRSLTKHHCIDRTDQALVELRQALEAGIRRKEIPDEHPAHQQRELINARQEHVRTLANLQRAVGRHKERAARYETAIQEHQDACEAVDIIPEKHDLALWSVLDDADNVGI